MAKFKKLMLLCTSILMCCMVTAFVGCSLFEPMDSSIVDSSSLTQESSPEEMSSSEETSSSDETSSTDDSANGGNWTGEAPLN